MGKKLIIGVNDLNTWCKQNGRMELLIEWNYEKNNAYSPKTITYGSQKKLWWKCSQGHEWESSVSDRTRGRNCPFCSGKRLSVGINDLSSRFPNLANEWHPTKNVPLIPSNVSCGSKNKVWWLGKCGHEWEATIYERAINHTSCPYCKNSKVLTGFNDLQTKFPELAKEWHPTKNGIVIPSEVLFGSHRKVWWCCEKGHEWKAQVKSRTRSGRGCPKCALETQSSFPEQAVFFYVSKIYADAKNRYVVDSFEIDVYVPSTKIGIEYDGRFYHSSTYSSIRETNKNSSLHKKGIRLIRIKESDSNKVTNDIIYYKYNSNYSFLNWAILSLFHILGIDFEDVDIVRDHNIILEQYIESNKNNSLALKYPDIAKEWNYDKNGRLTPSMFSYSSNKKIWWLCSKGHEWQDTISHRSGNRGCPYCSGRRIIKGENDLATTHSELVREWDYEKNIVLSPNDVSFGSQKKVWWRCLQGHEWEAEICSRAINNTGCPVCSGKKTLTGYNDLSTVNPNLAKEWDYDKNQPLIPTQVSACSHKKAWWKCSACGSTWAAVIKNRNNGSGCPYCSGKKVLVGINDLATVNPELAKEWNYEKNDALTPKDVSLGSKRKVWWKCKQDHEWEADICSRSRGNGCPFCSNVAPKPVVNIDTGEVFDNQSVAAKSCGINSPAQIGYVCKGIRKTAGGYHWKYAE